MALTIVRAEKISLKDHPDFNEAWIREKIADDPTILGLGELDVKDIERIQPKAGRLDLLLHDPEAGKRYEVELMLGPVDESHIIRCIEYWDIERKRYPQYEHVAVLIAEVVTTRFLNVINLFNSAIPIIALQLDALRVEDKLVLNFTKVLDEVERGFDEEVIDGKETDRAYWEKRSSKAIMEIADACLEILKQFNTNYRLKYNKNYIGIADEYRANNFIVFRAKRQFLRVEALISNQQPWLTELENVGISPLLGTKERKRIVFQLHKKDMQINEKLIHDLFAASFEEQHD